MFIKKIVKLRLPKRLREGRVAASLLLSAAIFLFSASYALAGSNVTVTRQFQPGAQAAVTSSAGDNNGFQTTPTYAYANGGGSAMDTNSGAPNNSVPAGTGTDKHNYYNYSLSSIPSGSTINGITVRVDMAVDTVTPGNQQRPYTSIRLSWDGGTSWTTEITTNLTAAAETTYNYGGSSYTWGRTWSTSELTDANFRVQVINGDYGNGGSARDFSLDWIPVSITFTAPWDSYSDSARTTINDNFTNSTGIVYMKGTGYPSGTYNVTYYDAGASGGQKTSTESGISVAGDGILNSQYLLNTDPSRVAGTWHTLAQSTSNGTAFPTGYDTAVASPDTYGILGNDAFTVQTSAIPEFPGSAAGIMVASACFGLYYWMRRRRLAYVKA